MKKMLLAALVAYGLTTTLQAEEFDPYVAIGYVDQDYSDPDYGAAKAISVRLGLTQEEGFGLEFEYTQPLDGHKDIDPTKSDLDLTTYASYATYRVMAGDMFALKARLGFLSENAETTTGKGSDRTHLSTGLQIDYEVLDDQIIYLGLTNTNTDIYETDMMTIGYQYLF